jgi:hypothetical protein
MSIIGSFISTLFSDTSGKVNSLNRINGVISLATRAVIL